MAGAQSPHAGTGESLFVSQLDVIERTSAFVCARHHLPAADADDFCSHVKLKLIEGDYAILRKFQGRSSLRTYLAVVIERLFLDYRISAWGRWRPSAEAKRAGGIGVLLEQLLVRDGHTVDEACELLTARHGLKLARAEVEAIVGRLPMRERRRRESEDALADVTSPLDTADHAVVEGERQALADHVSAVLRDVIGALDTQERLILVMRFEDGRSVADIAAALRLDQKALYRRVERLLRGLRSAIEAAGVNETAVMEMLESRTVTVEWSTRERAEKVMAGPSMAEGA